MVLYYPPVKSSLRVQLFNQSAGLEIDTGSEKAENNAINSSSPIGVTSENSNKHYLLQSLI